MTKRTPAQRERQKKEHREAGRYAKTNPCQRCSGSAGVSYHSFNDSVTDSLGNEWRDDALVLCKPCAFHLESLSEAEAWVEHEHKKWGSLPKGVAF